jgi:NTE family protein
MIALIGSIGTGGCASSQKKPEAAPVEHPAAAVAPQGPELFGPPEPYGPPLPPSADTPSGVYGPEPILFRPVVLVLGPGLARGYAYVGALRALSEAKIPIAAILGTEMGALVGSLYAMDDKINQFEWAMLKFREDAFETQGGLLPEMFQRSARAKKLEEDLTGVFENRDLSQSKLPVRIAIQTEGAGAAVVDRGPAVGAVRAAISDPELFGPGQWNGLPAVSAAKTKPLMISEARAMNLGPVVVIDAMEGVDEKKLVSADQLHDADLVIRPDLTGIGPKDFQKRTDAAFRGKSAVNSQIAEIRHLVGMPNDDVPSKGSP